MKKYRKFILFFALLIVLSPIGLFLPELFNAGDAWGEWSLETVKELTGFEPQGMKNDVELYSAPIPDYNLGNDDSPFFKKAGSYIISGALGIALIILFTFGLAKLLKNK